MKKISDAVHTNIPLNTVIWQNIYAGRWEGDRNDACYAQHRYQGGDPLANALLSKMGYNKSERIEIKKEFLRMLVRLELDPARTHFVAAFFDTYLILNAEEKQILREEIRKLDPWRWNALWC